jgi:hypothetical protein
MWWTSPTKPIFAGYPHSARLGSLEGRIFAFIDYYNRTMEKPFKWTYQGKALTA